MLGLVGGGRVVLASVRLGCGLLGQGIVGRVERFGLVA